MRCVSNFGTTSGPATFDQIFLKVELPLPTPKQTHADLCCFFNAVDHLAKSNGYLQHPLGSFRRLGEVAARQPTMYPASDAAVG